MDVDKKEGDDEKETSAAAGEEEKAKRSRCVRLYSLMVFVV